MREDVYPSGPVVHRCCADTLCRRRLFLAGGDVVSVPSRKDRGGYGVVVQVESGQSDSTPDGAGERVLLRPGPTEPSVYQGATTIDDYAVLSWSTEYGTIGLAYSLFSSITLARRFAASLYTRYGDDMNKRYSSVVVARNDWGLDAPELEAVDLYDGARHSDPYTPTWEQLATLLGTEAPWWHSTLRDRAAILGWSPGSPPAIVPACDPDLPTEALTSLAVDEPDGSPAAAVCLWLAQRIRRQSAESAGVDLKLIEKQRDGDCCDLVLGAVPAPINRPAPDPLPEVVRDDPYFRLKL